MRRRTLIAMVVGVALTNTVAPQATAAPPEHTSIGQRYADGLDTRLSATTFAQIAQRAGYAATSQTAGRSADDAWLDGLSSAMLGLFGHANGGYFQTGEGPTDPEDPILGVGSDIDVISPYSNLRLFSEYLPYTDVDDMRLLIVAGCHTSLRHSWLGSFTDLPVRRGVDAVVTFPDLVYFPASTPSTPMADTNYSGNYFWVRFSTHYEQGATAATALARARTDLLAKEGSAGGWDGYQIHGSVRNPGAVLLRPAGSGAPLTSDPVPSPDFLGFGSLTTTDVVDGVGTSGEPVREVRSQEGVTYRQRADGSVIDAIGTPSESGPLTLSEAEAAARADRFVSAVLGHAAETLVRTSAAPTGHGEGQQLVRSVYRTDQFGRRQVVVEVDRRTSAVVYFADVHAEGTGTSATVDEATAVRIAREHTRLDAAVAHASADTWDAARWIVTLDAGTSGRAGFEVPHVARVTVDAETGDVIRSEST